LGIVGAGVFDIGLLCRLAFSALMLSFRWQEGHPTCRKWLLVFWWRWWSDRSRAFRPLEVRLTLVPPVSSPQAALKSRMICPVNSGH